MRNFFKGFIIGIGKIIPGVSGALLAILMGVYDKSIFYINNFKDNRRESIKYLFPLGIGIILSVMLFSKVISYLLIKYYTMTMLFFVGLIIGTISSVKEKVMTKDYYLVIISVSIFLFLTFIGIGDEYLLKGDVTDLIVFFISGIFEAMGTVIPAISSTALLMSIGTYKSIVTCIGNIMNISLIMDNLRIIVPFGIGTIIGTIIVVKVVDYMFRRYYHKVYAIIFGLLIATIVTMIINTFKYTVTIMELFLGVVLMFIGIFISMLFDK